MTTQVSQGGSNISANSFHHGWRQK